MSSSRNKSNAKVAKQLNKSRRRKIDSLKNKIASGQYLVDNATLARALFMAR